jgi:pimeloyl-ACP methyl ester carboxylesterase
VAVLAGLYLVFQGLRDFELSEFESRPIVFDYDGYSVAGTLHLPRAKNPPVVLIVHGDGPVDRYSGGGYLPLISTFLDSGIAVYSWDKPGVGESGGDWLSFSMEARARLAETALAAVKAQPELEASPAGFLGFSQAGWVLPILAREPARGDFFVIVGGALNWLRQGEYFTRRRMELAGASPQEIETTLAARSKANRKLLSDDATYQDYLESGMDEEPMSEERFAFVHRNMLADSTEHLWRISAPVLSIHGSDDLNVDPRFNPNFFRQILEDRNGANRFVIVPNATHALLRSDTFNYQLEEDMPVWSKTAFVLLGRRAYAPGALETLTGWIKKRVPAGAVGETPRNR